MTALLQPSCNCQRLHAWRHHAGNSRVLTCHESLQRWNPVVAPLCRARLLSLCLLVLALISGAAALPNSANRQLVMLILWHLCPERVSSRHPEPPFQAYVATQAYLGSDTQAHRKAGSKARCRISEERTLGMRSTATKCQSWSPRYEVAGVMRQEPWRTSFIASSVYAD